MEDKMIIEKDTWKFTKQISRIVIPSMLQAILTSTILTSVDQMMLGKLGATSLTGAGLAGAYTGLFCMGAGGISAVTGIMIAQFTGSDDWKNVNKSFSMNMNIAIFLSIIFTILTFVAPTRIMSVYSQDAAVIAAGSDYLKVMAFFFLPFAIVSIISTMLRCMGKNLEPMLVGLGGGVANIILDWMFIFGNLGMKKMGVKGAAIATVGSQAMTCIILIIMLMAEYHRRNKKFEYTLNMSGKDLMTFLAILMPVIMDSVFWSIGDNAHAILYSHISPTDYSALVVTVTAATIMGGLLSGFSVAAGIVSGSLIGSKDYDGLKEASKKLCAIAFIFGVAICIILIALRRPYVDMFNISEELKQTTMKFLLVLYLYIPARAINITMLTGILRSGGQTKYPMYIGIGCTWLIGMPLALISGLLLHLPLVWVYALQNLEEIARCIAAYFLFKSGKWIKKDL